MTTPHLRAAIYARVSGEQQARDGTIASQLEAVTQRLGSDGFECDPELRFVDDGWTGKTLIRPGLERLRDQAAAGAIDRLYVLDPDRFSRKYAYQILMLEELTRHGVEVVFLCNPLGQSPAENLLRQVQGMIAEYEEAKILDAAAGASGTPCEGSVSVLSGAPYGYRYIGKHEGDGEARYQVVANEAQVVRKIFLWVGQDRCSIGEVCRRLKSEGSPHGRGRWPGIDRWSGRLSRIPRTRGRRPLARRDRGRSSPRNFGPSGVALSIRGDRSLGSIQHRTIRSSSMSRRSSIDALFDAVPLQLEENRQRRRARPAGNRYLLQGLIVCKRCGYGCYGKPTSPASSKEANPLRLLPMHGLGRVSIRWRAIMLEQAGPYRRAGCRGLG